MNYSHYLINWAIGIALFYYMIYVDKRAKKQASQEKLIGMLDTFSAQVGPVIPMMILAVLAFFWIPLAVLGFMTKAEDGTNV